MWKYASSSVSHGQFAGSWPQARPSLRQNVMSVWRSYLGWMARRPPMMESVAPWRAVLRALPADVPHAIEYPLIGDDLVAVTRAQLAVIRDARSLG